jgi:endogenous inhibitor of DNA gyrase (YacG/DUF329 family)
MDTSEAYQKMCKCPEIQSEWKPREGDFFAFCSDPKIIKDYEIWALENKKLSDIEEWNEIIKTMGGHFVDHFTEARECFVYLPRQDQIQEMMRCSGGSHVEIMKNFIDSEYHFTLERKWLAFYMLEKHSKTWDGEEWMKTGGDTIPQKTE